MKLKLNYNSTEQPLALKDLRSRPILGLCLTKERPPFPPTMLQKAGNVTKIP